MRTKLAGSPKIELKPILKAIAADKKYGGKIGICDRASSDYPNFTYFLVEFGSDSTSMNPDLVRKTWLEVATKGLKNYWC